MRIFRVAKKEAEQLEVGRAAPVCCYLRSCVRFSEHEFSRLSYYGGSIHPPGDTSRRTSRGRKKYCAVNVLTCPCCSAAPPLLDCSPWTDSCCCIHSSVSLQKRRETADEEQFVIFASDRSAKFLVGNNVGAPVKFFRRSKM